MEIPKEYFENKDGDKSRGGSDFYNLCLTLLLFAQEKVEKQMEKKASITMVVSAGEQTIMVHGGSPEDVIRQLTTGLVEIMMRQPGTVEIVHQNMIRELLEHLNDEEN